MLFRALVHVPPFSVWNTLHHIAGGDFNSY